MSKLKEPYKITCKEAQLLMVPLWANMRGIADEEKEAFNAHILVCSICAKKYEETKKLMSLVKANWGPISPGTRKLLEKAGYKVEEKLPQPRRMTVEEGWQDLLKRCPDIAEAVRRKKLRLMKRISAIAACLIIGMLTWLTFLNYLKPDAYPISKQTISVPIPSIKVELVKSSGNIALKANQKILADNELKTLLINGKHKMVLNIGTNLSIEPLTVNSNLGCLVKLNSGEIYTHVEHDGNPFVVQTANGNAIITGTTFNVMAKGNNTTLVVTEGTVLLKSQEGKVSVGAGQLSQIVNQSVPTKPARCNVSNLTAWATGYKPESALVQTESAKDCSWQPPLSSLRPEPIELDKTDYKSWVEEKREWFKKDFPWIFELKDALAKEGIEADYPELLIQTSDVWQFMCLEKFPAIFSDPWFDSLLRAAIVYGFDEKWLLENAPSAKIALVKKSCQQNAITGQKAFEQLLKYAEGKKVASYEFYIVDACKYIAETRSLIWFAVRDGKFNLTNTQCAEVLDLLQQEVTVASNCCNDLLYPVNEQTGPLCDEDLCETIVAKILKHAKAIKRVEEKITEYKIAK